MAIRLPNVLRAVKPGMSTLQRAIMARYIPGYTDPGVQQAMAVQAALQPYVEPHDRRQFFHNVLGLPHRAKQIQAATAEGDAHEARLRQAQLQESSHWDPDIDEETYADWTAKNTAMETSAVDALKRAASPFDAPRGGQEMMNIVDQLESTLSAAPIAEEPILDTPPVTQALLQALSQRFRR